MKKIIAAVTLAIASILPASSAEFFSTKDTETIFDLGVRAGFNTANRTISESVASIWNQNSWGLGFDIGAVCDVNFKDFISIQPGFFFETRSGSFAYQSTAYDITGSYVKTQVGKGTEYLFNIPIVASIHFNITDNLRWNVDFGPYVQIKLKSTFDKKFSYPEASTATGGLTYFDNVKTSKCDVGLKMGTGLDIYRHYYLGVHYLAGLLNPWNPSRLGGHNKAWMFTIGYNF